MSQRSQLVSTKWGVKTKAIYWTPLDDEIIQFIWWSEPQGFKEETKIPHKVHAKQIPPKVSVEFMLRVLVDNKTSLF